MSRLTFPLGQALDVAQNIADAIGFAGIIRVSDQDDQFMIVTRDDDRLGKAIAAYMCSAAMDDRGHSTPPPPPPCPHGDDPFGATFGSGDEDDHAMSLDEFIQFLKRMEVRQQCSV